MEELSKLQFLRLGKDLLITLQLLKLLLLKELKLTERPLLENTLEDQVMMIPYTLSLMFIEFLNH